MAPSTRCHITLNRPPTKTILTHPFNHRVDLILPTDLYKPIYADLHSSPPLARPLRCYRLTVPLSAIVETGFLTKYIKTGNVIMLSKGRIDVDNIYSLNDGILRLSLHRETYEKAGLVGKPARFGNTGSGGKKKKPNRYLVEINLRDPSMLHGKKGFERILWSFTNVLKDPIDFLFCDLEQQQQSSSSSSSPPCPLLTALSATPRDITTPPHHTTTASPLVLIPSLHPPPGARMHGGGASAQADYQREVWSEWALHVYEWLALVSLGPADRIKAGDRVDPYLSTYSVEQEEEDEEEGGGGREVTMVTFRGLVPAGWIDEVWKEVCALLDTTDEGREGWAALSVHGFENAPVSWGSSEHGSLDGGENGYTVLRLPLAREEEVVVGEVGRWIVYEVVGSQDEHS